MTELLPLSTTNNPHFSIAFHKAGEISAGLGHDFNLGESFQHFIPQDLQLHFSQAITKATMNAKAEGYMTACVVTVKY